MSQNTADWVAYVSGNVSPVLEAGSRHIASATGPASLSFHIIFPLSVCVPVSPSLERCPWVQAHSGDHFNLTPL